MMATTLFDMVGHVDEEALALFCARRLSPADEHAVSQHLRVCEECRERRARESSFHGAVTENRDLVESSPGRALDQKQERRRWEPRPREPGRKGPNLARGRLASPQRWFVFGWRPVAAFGALALLLAIAPQWLSQSSMPPGAPSATRPGPATSSASPPVEIRLEALRGETQQRAPAGQPLRLRLDFNAANAGGPVEVHIVNRLGSPVAKGPAQADNGATLFSIHQPLEKGQYWVRLLQNGRLLKEYSLLVS